MSQKWIVRQTRLGLINFRLLDKLGVFPAELRQLDAIFAPLTSSLPQFLRKTLPPRRFLNKSPPTALPPLHQQLPPPLPLCHHDDDENGEGINLGFFWTVRCPQSIGNSRQGSGKVVLPASWQAGKSSAKGRWSEERSFFCHRFHQGNGSSPRQLRPQG